MKSVIYMHSGSGNHGCEALVRTTSEVLKKTGEVDLWSFSGEEDLKYHSVDDVRTIYESEALKKFSIPYFEALIKRKMFRQSDANMKVFLREIFRNKVAVSIGGDTYCYPWSAKQSVELNREIRKWCTANILWGCSIDEKALTSEVREDLADYDLITARESITYNMLKETNPNTVLTADTAFLLDTEYAELPKEFIPGNTVGINISPLIMKYGTEENLILENYKQLISFILNDTDMNVCLIPHVVWEYNDDRVPCRYLLEQFRETGRVCMIEDGNCKEIKGYIARCRFLVAARTHASIAAYSSYVPTLVVGYSVKSRGIATDLFGAINDYVLSVQNLSGINELTQRFQWIMENETNIIRQLKVVVPTIRKRALKSTDLLEQYNFESRTKRSRE